MSQISHVIYPIICLIFLILERYVSYLSKLYPTIDLYTLTFWFLNLTTSRHRLEHYWGRFILSLFKLYKVYKINLDYCGKIIILCIEVITFGLKIASIIKNS